MYCKSCDQQSPDEIIKYKLVIDILDDEQDGQLILWDNVCSPLLGITASELKGKYSEVSDFVFEHVYNIIRFILFNVYLVGIGGLYAQ